MPSTNGVESPEKLPTKDQESPGEFDRQGSPDANQAAYRQYVKIEGAETSDGIKHFTSSVSSTLSPAQVAILKNLHKEKARRHVSAPDLDHGGHAHHDRPASIITAVISGVINWLLMFGLCCAYGMILFNDDWHVRHRTLGVKMNLFTACFAGLILAGVSKIPVAVGGPDLNPVVFLAGFVQTIGKSIAEQLALDYPSAGKRRLNDWSYLAYSGRGLGSISDSDVEFCEGEHLAANFDACGLYHEELIVTVMFAVAISSALLGLIFILLGQFRLTRFVAFVPTSIMEAFLSCVGYKVFKYALKFSSYEPNQFIPAALCGVTLYFVKALHLGNPAVMIPLFLFIPLGIFYIIIFSSGSDVDKARSDGFFFPELPDVGFWTLWQEGFGNAQSINFKAWKETLPDLVIMVVVCLLDCLLKLAGTESKLKINVDKDYEIKIHGLSNILTTCSFSSVGYMQLKFNVINYGVMGNLIDRRGGFVYAILCGAGFFGTIQYFNFMPRFFLSLLLFFAGSGFVAENLWGSRNYLRGFEWLEICIILVVFIFTEKLLYAVAVGALLTCLSFVKTCAGIPVLLGTNIKGGRLATSDRHEHVAQYHLEHITDAWLMVIRLKGFVFFGSAQKLIAVVRSKIQEQGHLPEYKRMRFLIFDCKLLDGMDASASRSIKNLSDEASAAHITILWSCIDDYRAQEFKGRGILKGDAEWFNNLNESLLFVQAHALKYMSIIQNRWLNVHPALELYQRVLHNQDDYGPFRQILTMDIARHGCPWVFCDKVPLERYKTLLWSPGMMGVPLFLVHTGAVGLYTTLPGKDANGQDDSQRTPIAMFRHGWFLNSNALLRSQSQFYAVALEDGEAISWNEKQWFRMTHEQPHMASAITKAVFNQQQRNFELIQRQAETVVDQAEALPSDFQRNNSSDSSGSIVHMESGETIEYIPEEVRHLFATLSTVVILEKYGCFGSPVTVELGELEGNIEPSLARLPPRFLVDLEIAFDTYKKKEGNPNAAARMDVLEDRLARADAIQALKFCGISNAFQLADGDDLTFNEFLLLGRASLVARFNPKQLESVREVFKRFDTDNSGELSVSELQIVLKETVHPFVSLEDLVGITAFWDADHSGMIDVDEFTALVARQVKKCEQEWSALCALRQLAGNANADITEHLTSQSLVANSDLKITEEMAAEMLWVTDWRTGRGSGAFLELRDVPAFLQLHLEEIKGELPPTPHERYMQPVSQKNGDRLNWKIYRKSHQCAGEISLSETAEFTVDLRNSRTRENQMNKMAEIPRAAVKGLATMYSENKLSLVITKNFDEIQLEIQSTGVRTSWIRRVDEFLNNAKSSRAAGVFAVVSILAVCLSIFLLFLEQLVPSQKDVWWYFEEFVTIFFTVELVLRASVTHSFIAFVTSLRNICDFVAIIPFYMEVIIGEKSREWELLRINRVVRLFRLMKGYKWIYSRGLTSAAGAMVTIFAVVWGIYLKYTESKGDKK